MGARRLEHLQYLVGDPLVARFCGLARVPTARTVSNWLKHFAQTTLAPLLQLNHDLVVEILGAYQLPRLIIDVDGTLVSTSAQVQWAFRDFNPHHRKHRCDYPLLAHVAQTGHMLRLKNRPGNVHDSKQAVEFVRDLIDSVHAGLGRAVPVEFHMDAASFQPQIARPLAARGCAYAIKVGYWSWLAPQAARLPSDGTGPPRPGRQRLRTSPDHSAMRLEVRVMIYRKHVRHESRKNFQLDLFTPDDGNFEYYAVAADMTLGVVHGCSPLVCGPWRPGEEPSPNEGRVCARRRLHEPLRGQ